MGPSKGAMHSLSRRCLTVESPENGKREIAAPAFRCIFRFARASNTIFPGLSRCGAGSAANVMKLLSVNVAMPAAVASNGRRVKTSIFKKPVEGPVAVRTLNLEGDQQSDLRVHGGTHKAVYAYSWQNVEHWRQYLKRDDLGPGSFGENLTIEGLTDGEIAVGDELEIGTARFAVTQPRIPCFKLGIALGLPEFPKVFHWAGRNGFYLRVQKEGVIQAGDDIRVLPVTASAHDDRRARSIVERQRVKRGTTRANPCARRADAVLERGFSGEGGPARP